MSFLCLILLIGACIGGQAMQFIRYASDGKLFLFNKWASLLHLPVSWGVLIISCVLNIIALICACISMRKFLKAENGAKEIVTAILTTVAFCAGFILCPVFAWLIILIASRLLSGSKGTLVSGIVSLLCVASCFFIEMGGLKLFEPRHEHSEGVWQVTVEASCSQEGKKERICECGKSLEEEILPINADNHIHKDWTVTKPATCTDTGTKYEKCLDCEKLLQMAVIETHPNRLIIQGKEATCVEDGVTEDNRCNDCGEVFSVATVIPALGHDISEQSALEATCLQSGWSYESHCERCKEVFNPREEIPALGHAYSMLTNACERCSEKEYPEVKARNELENAGSKYVLYLDYIVSGNQIMTIDSGAEYIRFVGTAGTWYSFRLNILDRKTPLYLDFVNTTLCYQAEEATIFSNSKSPLYLGFYGENSSIRGATGQGGTNGGPFRDAKNGQIAVDIEGDLHITVGGESCSIYGGNGGRGGNGSVGNDGGRGGNGAMAIYASSIKVSFKEGYTKSNFSVAGGSGGEGGDAGGWFLGQPSKGANGSGAKEANVQILYEE